MTKLTNLNRIRDAFSKVFDLRALKTNISFDESTQPARRASPMCIDRLADELPYAHFSDEDCLCAVASPSFNEFEGLGFVIEIQPQTGADSLMAKTLMQMFGQITPENTGIQVSLFGSPFIEPLTDIIESTCVKHEGNESDLRHEQIALMQSLSTSRSAFARRSLKRSSQGYEKPYPKLSLLGLGRGPLRKAFENAQRDKVVNLRESIMSLLKQWHLHPFSWTKDILINTVSQLLNQQQFLNSGWNHIEPDSGREPRMQCVAHDTRIEVKEDGIRFYSAYEKREVVAVALSARNYPQDITLNLMSYLCGTPRSGGSAYPCPFLVTTYATTVNYESAKSSATLKSARAQQMASTEIAKFIPSLQEEARDWMAAAKSFEGSEGLLQLSHQVILFCEPKAKEEAIQAAKSIFQNVGIELGVDDYMHFQALLVGLPMTGGPLLAHDVKIAQRCTTKTAANAANTLPLIADWKGTPPRAGNTMSTPLITMVSRRGQLVHIDPFANPNGNYNGAISGASGSGKSNLLNDMALGALRTGGRVWIIDVGRSYEKLCHVVQGQWIELSDKPRSDGKIDCLNPFSLVTNIDEDMDLMLPLLAQMASPSKPLDDLYLNHLSIHFKYIWTLGRAENRLVTITDLADSLIHNGRIGGANPRAFDPKWHDYYASLSLAQQEKLNDPRVSDLGVMLAPYCKNGAYASYFEGEANLNFDNHFIVLELEQLKTKKALQSVVLLLLMYLIEQEMRKGARSQSKLVIIDEAWDLMGEGHSAKFIETGYRRARKLNGAFFTATQSPADYWKSETAKAALENADCVFMLRQKGEVIENLKRNGQIGLNEGELTMLSSLTTVAGMYSEVMVKIGDSPASVNRLILDPYSRLLMSSHPTDVNAVESFKAQGFSTHEAIEEVLKARGEI